MSLPLFVREAAQEDIRMAVAWYERQTPELGAEFINSLDSCLSLIRQWPETFPEVHRNSRMAVLRRFPCLVIYRNTPRFISIIAVIHGSRDPRRWKARA